MRESFFVEIAVRNRSYSKGENLFLGKKKTEKALFQRDVSAKKKRRITPRGKPRKGKKDLELASKGRAKWKETGEPIKNGSQRGDKKGKPSMKGGGSHWKKK